MKITIKINTESAAFVDNPPELSRILHKLAETVRDWPGASRFEIGLRDINGNNVGSAKATKPRKK